MIAIEITQAILDKNPNLTFNVGYKWVLEKAPKTWNGREGYHYLSEAEHKADGFYPVQEHQPKTEHQNYGPLTFDAENEQWHYPIVDMTQAEIDAHEASKIPQQVKNMKLRLALIQSGISISSIEQSIQAIPDQTTRDLISTMWEYAEYYERDNQQLIAMASQLGITDAQLDQLFMLAETL